MPISETLYLCLLFGLAAAAIGTEVLRRAAGRPAIWKGQFGFRMFGGAVMLFLVTAIAFGAIFIRPEDGKVFGWYWTFCAVTLLGLLIIIREDVARTRRGVLVEYERLRDDHLKDIQQLFRDHEARQQGPGTGPE